MSGILVICSGNICRSPLGEHILRRELDRTPAGRAIAAASAGTLGIVDKPADPHSVSAAAEIGLDLRDHRSSALTTEQVGPYDALLVMEEYHADFVRMLDASCGDRVVRVWQHARLPRRLLEIPDPIGEDLDAFRECRDLLARCIETWLPTWLSSRGAASGDAGSGGR